METFSLEHFNDFLAVANRQPTDQTLLLVLAKRELPHGHTPEQAKQFSQGLGGHLAPLGGIAKSLNTLSDFSAFAREATQVTPHWDTVFVAAIDAQPPSDEFTELTDSLIDKMVDDIRSGLVSQFLTFDHTGVPLQLNEG